MSPTPTYGWPFPTGPGPVNVPGDIANLANAIDATFADGGWQAITVLAGKAAHVSNAPQVRKIGNRVIVRGGFMNTGVTAGASTTVGTIPAAYKPNSLPVYLPAIGSTGNQYSMFVIDTAGGVTIRCANTAPDYFLFPGELSGWLIA